MPSVGFNIGSYTKRRAILPPNRWKLPIHAGRAAENAEFASR
jgi:hypothetical protein